jgi:phosphoglucosamine mutase
LAQPANIGRAKRIEDVGGRYVEYAKTTLPRGSSFAGLKIVLDCANGAAYKVAPQVLWELGAEVIQVGTSPNGTNINLDCGSTHPRTAAAKVLETGADLGIALDGDADRVILIDERGQVADGDQIMALFARRWADDQRLRGGVLVATVMSNLGLERFLTGRGLRMERTAVGDRYVVERMRAGGWNLGGEQSGHIVMTDYATTGDGLIAALQFMAAMVDTGKPASMLARNFDPVPQMLRNLKLAAGVDVLARDDVRAAIDAATLQLDGRGRLLIRKSGTEPLVRVMAECEDEALMTEIVDGIIATMQKVA